MSSEQDRSAINSESSQSTGTDGLAAESEAYVRYGEALIAAVEDSFGPWLERELRRRLDVAELPEGLSVSIEDVRRDVHVRLTELVHADVDTPLSGPLERMRVAVEALVPVLDGLGLPVPARDPFDEQLRPNDRYALGPYTFADVGSEVHEAGIAWGAAKAYLHRARRK